MNNERFNRLILLIGEPAFKKLQQLNVIIFGIGGVGSWCAESLVRSGLGHITIVDCDRIDITNTNRQIPALSSTIGREKTEVLKDRLLDINPDADVRSLYQFYSADTAETFNLSDYDYVVDAIDSLSDKALLILNATRAGKGTQLISSMGAALKMDASKIGIAEFWDVKGCPLAAALRHKFRRSGIFPAKKFKCVFSPEIFHNRGIANDIEDTNISSGATTHNKKASINGSIMHTTAIFGLQLAGIIIQDVIEKQNSNQ